MVEKYIEKLSLLEKCKRRIKSILKPLFLFFYIPKLKTETFFYNQSQKNKPIRRKGKNLYFVAAGEKYKHLVEKVVERFGHDDFDYLIIVHDGSQWNESVFEKCQIIHDTGFYHYFVKKYVTPELVEKYDYLFLWDDDLDIMDFSYKNFLEIFERNYLQLAQPALTRDSYYSFKLTLKDDRYSVGRYTDVVEVMAPVFKSEFYLRYWDMVETDYNYWGWGYDTYARSKCGYVNLGIIDQEPIRHTKALREDMTDNRGDYERFKKENQGYMLAKFVSYGGLG